MDAISDETHCPFSKTPVDKAYGPEVSMFLHCHLRGYDRHGEGKVSDNEYYDKYGAPVDLENSWEEGYHVVERKIAGVNDLMWALKDLDFPLFAGVGGGVHIYKPIHDEKPWNWTGWVPRKRRWCNQGKFFSNRYYLTLRGNEIQNNLWDYHPHEEEEGAAITDTEYEQLEPNDRYRGGYWFHRQPFGRYLHIIALKSHEVDPKTNLCPRYNYIVHPLAYRASIHKIPDNSVDAMQWCIINMPEEQHFGKGQPWGEKCHGLEIFNDFTYYYSYQPIEKNGGVHNSELGYDKERSIDDDHQYYYWFDTYPMEFAVFLLDSALARGVYFHTMAANDAFYEDRDKKKEEDQDEGKDLRKEQYKKGDPKAGLFKHPPNKLHERKGVKEIYSPTQTNSEIATEETEEEKAINKFWSTSPYKDRTVFGYITLVDPARHITETVFAKQDGIPLMRLDEGEKVVLDYLIKGRYFAATGISNLFNYDNQSIDQKLPYMIKNQPNPKELCHDITGDMELVFTFLPCTAKNAGLIWRYTIMVDTSSNELATTHGYFKLNEKHTTKLDLRSYVKYQVKWLYFTAIKAKNPQHRAWLHAIRGPAFGPPVFHAALPLLKHRVEETERKQNTVVPKKFIAPTAVDPKGNLDFALGRTSNQNDTCVYFMQVYPLQQDFTNECEDIKESSDLIPPRILQSVHGYFNLRIDHPTRLNLSASWDQEKMKQGEDMVYFYMIDAEDGQPKPMPSGMVKPFGNGEQNVSTA